MRKQKRQYRKKPPTWAECLRAWRPHFCHKWQVRWLQPCLPQVSAVITYSVSGIWIRVVPWCGALGEEDSGVTRLRTGCLQHGRVDVGQTPRLGHTERWETLVHAAYTRVCMWGGRMWLLGVTGRWSLPGITAINARIKMKYGSSSHVQIIEEFWRTDPSR